MDPVIPDVHVGFYRWLKYKIARVFGWKPVRIRCRRDERETLRTWARERCGAYIHHIEDVWLDYRLKDNIIYSYFHFASQADAVMFGMMWSDFVIPEDQ